MLDIAATSIPYVPIAIVLAVSLFLAYLGGHLQRTPKDAPPIYSTGIPVFGTFLKFSKGPAEFVRKAYDTVGDVFTMRMFGQRLTFLIGPDAHKTFFDAREADASQAEVYKFMTPVFGKGIVYDAPTKVRMQQMRFVGHSLKTQQLQSYIPKIIKEVETYVSSWGESGEVNMMQKMAELTILTASASLMGPEIRQNLFAQVADLYADLDAGLTPLSVFYPTAPIPAHFKRNRARAAMVKLFSKVIASRRASGTRHDDCLQAFMDCTYRDGTSLTDDAITGLMIALLFAGQHTSSITTTWTILFILHHPKVLEDVLAEQREVLGGLDPSIPLDWDKINKFDCLHRCIKEALRLFPPLIFVMRKLKKEMRVGKYVIPEGDTIFAAPGVAMRVPGVFTNPDSFDPDRFLPSRAEDTKKPYSFVGFGGGIHACLGENFAYMQVKTIVSVMLRRYTMTPVSKEIPKPNVEAMVVGPHAHQTCVRFQTRAPEAGAGAGVAMATA